ncbi:ribosome recycling factor [Sesbania bispinosa]|nr:ribosome recycling factor [Sesbania bispinosa]
MFRGESGQDVLGLARGIKRVIGDDCTSSKSDFGSSDLGASGGQFDSGSCYAVSVGDLMAGEQAELPQVPRWAHWYSWVVHEVLGTASIYRPDAPVG